MSKARDLADGTFSGDFSADSPTLVVDAVNNNVGINSTSPQTKLVVRASDSEHIEISGNWIQSFNRSGSPGYASLPFYASDYTFNVGAVSIPSQPAARASYGGGNLTNSKIPLNANTLSRGGMSIDSTNNRITVPVSGWYKIGWHHLANTSGASIRIEINGSAIQGSYTQQTSGGNGSFSSQIIASLSANDYIEWFIGATNYVHGNSSYNTMYAHLLG